MDPLSITAASVGLANGVGVLLSRITIFVMEVRSARKDMDTVVRELQSLQLSLVTLKGDEQTSVNPLPPTIKQQVLQIIVNCDVVTQQMNDLLVKLTSGRLGRRIQWSLTDKDEVNRLRSSLEANKSALEIALILGTISMLTQNSRSVSSGGANLDIVSHFHSIQDSNMQINTKVGQLAINQDETFSILSHQQAILTGQTHDLKAVLRQNNIIQQSSNEIQVNTSMLKDIKQDTAQIQSLNQAIIELQEQLNQVSTGASSSDRLLQSFVAHTKQYAQTLVIPYESFLGDHQATQTSTRHTNPHMSSTAASMQGMASSRKQTTSAVIDYHESKQKYCPSCGHELSGNGGMQPPTCTGLQTSDSSVNIGQLLQDETIATIDSNTDSSEYKGLMTMETTSNNKDIRTIKRGRPFMLTVDFTPHGVDTAQKLSVWARPLDTVELLKTRIRQRDKSLGTDLDQMLFHDKSLLLKDATMESLGLGKNDCLMMTEPSSRDGYWKLSLRAYKQGETPLLDSLSYATHHEWLPQTFFVGDSETIAGLKNKVQAFTSIGLAAQHLLTPTLRPLRDTDTIQTAGLFPGMEPIFFQSRPNIVLLRVILVDDNLMVTMHEAVPIDKKATIDRAKIILCEDVGASASDMRLILEGSDIDFDATLEDFDVQDGTVVKLQPRQSCSTSDSVGEGTTSASMTSIVLHVETMNTQTNLWETKVKEVAIDDSQTLGAMKKSLGMSDLAAVAYGAGELIRNDNETIKEIGLGQGSRTTTTHLRLLKTGKRWGLYSVIVNMYRRVGEYGQDIEEYRALLDSHSGITVLDWWKNLGLHQYLEPEGELRVYFDGRSMRLSRPLSEGFQPSTYRDDMIVAIGKAFHPRTATVTKGGLLDHPEVMTYVNYEGKIIHQKTELRVGESVTINPLPSTGSTPDFTFFQLTPDRPTGRVDSNHAMPIQIDMLHHYVSERITF